MQCLITRRDATLQAFGWHLSRHVAPSSASSACTRCIRVAKLTSPTLPPNAHVGPLFGNEHASTASGEQAALASRSGLATRCPFPILATCEVPEREPFPPDEVALIELTGSLPGEYLEPGEVFECLAEAGGRRVMRGGGFPHCKSVE